MKHVIFFSGGIGSWAAAKRVAAKHGTNSLILLFTDTMMEDEDLYRFLKEAHANIGGELVTIADGRNPWEVFFDVKFLGNSRIDPCSRILKREISKKWVHENFKSDEVTLYLGIDWTEEHRWECSRRFWEPYIVDAPLCHPPFVTKAQLFNDLDQEGIEVPRLYKLGFSHNNCGGFCIKAGQGQFKMLLEKMPERYAFHEQRERERDQNVAR